jgi:glycosyltransferase involved in cell wall biosynthesis
MKKRVLFIDEDQERNGTTVSLEYIVRGFVAAGYEATVLTWKVEDWTKAELARSATLIDCRSGPFTRIVLCVHFLYSESPFSLAGVTNIFKDVVKFIVGLIVVFRMIRRVRPDLVYVNEYSVVQASLAARICHVPSMIHIRSQMLSGRFGVRVAMIRRLVLGCNDAVFAITRCEAEQLRARPDEAAKIHVVGEFMPVTGVERTAPADARRQLGLPEGMKLVTMVGGIAPVKGTMEFLRAAEDILARSPSAFVALAGGKRNPTDARGRAYVEECVRRIEELQSQGRFLFLGELPTALNLIAASDVLASTSMMAHFARPVIEAWGFGKPVVAFRSRHNEDLITDNVNGLLIECGDTRALADAVVRLLNNDELSRQLGSAGMEKVKSEFDADKNVAAIIQHCEAAAYRVS